MKLYRFTIKTDAKITSKLDTIYELGITVRDAETKVLRRFPRCSIVQCTLQRIYTL